MPAAVGNSDGINIAAKEGIGATNDSITESLLLEGEQVPVPI
jgi:hypothetical protein